MNVDRYFTAPPVPPWLDGVGLVLGQWYATKPVTFPTSTKYYEFNRTKMCSLSQEAAIFSEQNKE